MRKDGSRFWAEVFVTALRDPQGQLIGFSKVTRDLTERKRVDDALLEQRDFLQSVVDNVPGLIMVKDREGRFRLANNLLAKVYGVTLVPQLAKVEG
ncbi:MAG: PAS domain S-box protein [Chloroflexota bacterium]